MDLYEWIDVLNKIDFLLIHILQNYPNILLIAPVVRKEQHGDKQTDGDRVSFSKTLEEAMALPSKIISALDVLLRFLAGLLRNSTNKNVFNSVEELVDLLAAANDDIARLALQCLASVAIPPSLHKQQAPEGHQHISALHSSKTTSHNRLLALARGWGSRGSGLGLHVCVTADDSDQGQGSLPIEAGEVNFQFFPSLPKKASTDKHGSTETGAENDTDSKFRSIVLSADDMKQNPAMNETTGLPSSASANAVKSSAELFFHCCMLAGGRENIPQDRLFTLLADIRLARSFHSAEMRKAGVENRLLALVCILYAHSSQEIMSGYFQAQPELLVELVDLIRPTVSTATVSAASSGNAGRHHSIVGLADPTEVPYTVRNLALETLTALVARRDGTSGGLTGVARQANVLIELGVGKGLYLGILPTLVMYSLASLGSFLANDRAKLENGPKEQQKEDEEIALEVGLSFVHATRPPQSGPGDQVMRALRFIDTVLTLTSAVVSAPSGTAALTDCGLIPALLNTVAVNTKTLLTPSHSSLLSTLTEKEVSKIEAQLRFVVSQCIQILEGAIVTHNAALSSFHELRGIDVLIARLDIEIQETRRFSSSETESESSSRMDVEESTESMEVEQPTKQTRVLVSSRRVLLFSIVNCLTVVFHQESTSASATAPFGGNQLRKPELTASLVDIIQHINSYGGVLVALTASLLADVMNSDPHVVYHVHECGLATAFFDMMTGNEYHPDFGIEPILPPVAELIMALPNVIAALSLTADGALKVKEKNPFPAMLGILHHPKYAMPRSRCLLNEMTAIVGNGLDEIMRHVPSLRPQVIAAIVDAMKETVRIGKELTVRERSLLSGLTAAPPALENERTCLMQYALNFGQMIEQVLHSQDHCGPFVQAGGVEAIMELFPLVLPPGPQFISNGSCLSCPSVSTLAHTTTEDSLAIAFRSIAISYDSQKMIQIVSKTLETNIESYREALSNLRTVLGGDGFKGEEYGLLDLLPQKHLYLLKGTTGYSDLISALSSYCRELVTLQWQSNLLATVIRAACQRSQESGMGWGRGPDREWKKELSSESFERMVAKLCSIHQSSTLEACRFRAKDEFESQHLERLEPDDKRLLGVQYRLRIVCQEGAVVRDGIEIDSCNNVGAMEMGEVVDAFDRCVNSSGVMRYRTERGWISELTRGHGREPIAEVLDVNAVDQPVGLVDTGVSASKRIEFRPATIACFGASMLARLQSSYRELHVAISRVVGLGIKSITVPTISYQHGTVGGHVRSLLKLLTESISASFNQLPVKSIVLENRDDDIKPQMTKAGAAMYFGTMLGHLNSCLFEDKRERKMVNVALLLAHSLADNKVLELAELKSENDHSDSDPIGLFTAAGFVLAHTLENTAELRSMTLNGTRSKPQSLSRSVAASLPATVFLLRRLASRALFKSSQLLSGKGRLSKTDTEQLVSAEEGDRLVNLCCVSGGGDGDRFSPDLFARIVHLVVARMMLKTWRDKRLCSVPPQVIYPLADLAGEIVSGIEDALNSPSSESTESNSATRSWPSRLFGRIAASSVGDRAGDSPARQAFEPSEEVVQQLVEMGFSREHALDAIESTESNQVEVAVNYAISHRQTSPETLERRRARREERRRRRQGALTNDGNVTNERNEDSQGADTGDAESPDGEGRTNASQGEPADSSAEMENVEDSKPKPTIDNPEQVNAMLKTALQTWMEAIPSVPIDLLCAKDEQWARDVDKEGEGGEREASTTVASSFLLNFCRKHPERWHGVSVQILTNLRTRIVEVEHETGIRCTIAAGEETVFSKLCHASVLVVRALPRLRVLLLKMGLATAVSSCLETFCANPPESSTAWPTWVSPSLLLLESMSQPATLTPGDDSGESDVAWPEKATIGRDEFNEVKAEHEQQVSVMASTAESMVTNFGGTKSSGGASSQTNKQDSEKADAAEEKQREKSGLSEGNSPFQSVPSYHPLMPSRIAESAMRSCLKILSMSKDDGPVPPGIVHAALVLLARILRSPKIASLCLHTNITDLLLGLPRGCRFVGCSAVVTTILRRVMEDETNLQAAMEIEIRSLVVKLHKTQGQDSQATKPTVSRSRFVKAAIPLLCRDPPTFMRAAFTTVSFESDDESKDQGIVTLLPNDKRVHRMQILAESKSQEGTKRGRSLTQQKPSKSKSPHRSSLSRRGSSPKKGKRDSLSRRESFFSGSPANQIISLLVNKVTELWSSNDENPTDTTFGETNSFLWMADLLEILADLVLAIPACAMAVHRFRVSSPKDHPLFKFKHALSGCPKPPRTFVSFLMHCLLPQDRGIGMDWKDSSDRLQESKKNSDFLRVRVAQMTARLLVALVARSGEGRKRVLADLAFALSGGDEAVSQVTTSKIRHEVDFEHRALKAWGELCIGLVAPRNNGHNNENNSSLSFEVVRSMLDLRMAQSLLSGIRSVNLHHPMAGPTCASLLIPLEVFSRPTVTDVVQSMAEKELRAKGKDGKASDGAKGTKKKTNSLLPRNVSAIPSRPEPVFADADDAMIEDSFEADAGVLDRFNGDLADEEMESGEMESQDDEDDNQEAMGIDEEDEEDDDEEDDDEEDEDSDDVESDDESGGSESDGESEIESDEDIEDESDDSDGEPEDSDLLEPVNEGSWNEAEGDDGFFDGDDLDDEGDEEMVQPNAEVEFGDWDRIEPPEFTGMLLGARRNGRGAHASSRARGIVDAAEAMLGSLLRSGEIQGDTLAEIEGTLGIRIMQSRRRPSEFGNYDRGGSWTVGGGGSGRQDQSSGEGETLAAMPTVQQRSPPDVGYSVPGAGGRWSDIGAMEFVFGGPSMAIGNRNYDVVSRREPDDEDAYPTLSAAGSQLFPGGPVSATHSRTPQALHPLLSGVDLPPLNALVSDLRSHNARSARSPLTNQRQNGDWGSLYRSPSGIITADGGGIVRLRRQESGPLGWSDERLAAATGDFSTAFETALVEVMSARHANDADTASQAPVNMEVSEPTTTAENEETVAPESQPEENPERPLGTETEAVQQSSDSPGANEAASPASASDGVASGVASSLASSLRLTSSEARDSETPPRDETEASIQPPHAQTETSRLAAIVDQDVQLSDAPAVADRPSSSSTENDTQDEEQDVSQAVPSQEATNAVPDTQDSPSDGGGDGNESGPQPNPPAAQTALVCPPGMDLEVFNSLPEEMQREVVDQHQETLDVAAQIGDSSGYDPEALAALPEDVRQEVILQERQARRMRDQAPADPSNAEDMDNASFVASLDSELRREILATADDAFLSTLPPGIRAEAQILRERASLQRRGDPLTHLGHEGSRPEMLGGRGSAGLAGSQGTSQKRLRFGKVKVDHDRDAVVHTPQRPGTTTQPFDSSDLKMLVRLMFLLSPVRPQRLLQKVFQNLCTNAALRCSISVGFTRLLHSDGRGASAALNAVDGGVGETTTDFPPPTLIGAAPELLDTTTNDHNHFFFRRRQTNNCSASIAANLPSSARGSQERRVPPVVATRVIETLLYLGKNSPRFCLDMLTANLYTAANNASEPDSCFEHILALLALHRYSRSATNLDQLLAMIEVIVSPLSALPREAHEEAEVPQKDLDAASAAGKEFVDVPRVVISSSMLQLLCSTLKSETCRDSAFSKVNAIARRLCRVDMNRARILVELASVAQALGEDAIRDLQVLNIRLSEAVRLQEKDESDESTGPGIAGKKPLNIVTLSTSSSEVKLLRVLQTLHSLCSISQLEDQHTRKQDGLVTSELVQILQGLDLDNLWRQLSACLTAVKVLEGVSSEGDFSGEGKEENDDEEASSDGENNMGSEPAPEAETGTETTNGKRLQNSAAGLLTRFLPAIEAFFIANALATRPETAETPQGEKSGGDEDDESDKDGTNLVGGKKVLSFVAENRVILNALIRNNPAILDKGLRVMVQVSRCRSFLDFDVKRQWFKTQIRRLRQQASRRNGSLRLSIRRKHVFEDAYHQLRLRNADEMRSRLHITFRDEDGVDAGGLSREFFGILAKEIFNPNYALFTSTSDGCTFQPNQHSSINPDHLSYLRFVGRIVGKAVADGFLLDAHFTRSLYKHMLGLKVRTMHVLRTIMQIMQMVTHTRDLSIAAHPS